MCELTRSGALPRPRETKAPRNLEFPELVEAALRRRQLLWELATRREKLGLSQTVVAAR